MGMQGGFMLGSGCEVPLNARPENVKAMIDSLRG
jgi:uroporphyrinogen-III decarboxylase